MTKSLTDRTLADAPSGPLVGGHTLPVALHASDEFRFRGTPFTVAHSALEPQDPSWFCYHDEEDVRERDWDVRPGDVVLDVGAAYGSYTMCALAAGASRAYAWSPQSYPRAGVAEADYLAITAALNGWTDKVTVVPGGAHSRDGWLDCLTQEFWTKRPAAPRDENDLLEVRTLDSWARGIGGLPRLDWVKLDVEGAEAAVLVGARDLLARHRPRVQVELHTFKDGATSADVDAVMRATGYSLVRTTPYHGVSHAVYGPR